MKKGLSLSIVLLAGTCVGVGPVWSQTGTKTDSQRGTAEDPSQRPDEAARKQGVPAKSGSESGVSQGSTRGKTAQPNVQTNRTDSQKGTDVDPSLSSDEAARKEGVPAKSSSQSGMSQSSMRGHMGGQSNVRAAQEALRDKGFNPGPIDGIMGPRTQAALRSFQQSNSLQATGRLDSQTTQQLGVEATSSR
jgi:hypothetical protein